MAKSFQCTLVTPQEQVLDEPVAYASVPAWDGLVGIAPQRAALLVKLGDGPLRLDMAQGESRHLFLSGGFAEMKDNRLTLLTDEAVPIDQIDGAEAQREFGDAQSVHAVTDEEVAQKRRRVERARTMAKLAGR